MNITDLLVLVLSYALGFSGSVEYNTSQYAYAVASIPPGSSATYVRVRLSGEISAECTSDGIGVMCSTTLIQIDAPPFPMGLEGHRSLPVDVESDGAWSARLYVRPYPVIEAQDPPARPPSGQQRVVQGAHEMFLPGIMR